MHLLTPVLADATSLLLQMLQPLQSEYVDRRFDGTKVSEVHTRSALGSTMMNC
jgi:hypothetical protein